MLKNITKITFLLALVAVLGFSQTSLVTPTLSSAVSTYTQNTITLSSGSGITTWGPQNQINTVCYVDKELMNITSLVSGTTYNVQRGQAGTRPFVHASGAKVYCGAPAGNFRQGTVSSERWGSCYAPNEVSLPQIYVVTGDIVDCKNGTSGGQWVVIGNGTMLHAGSEVRSFCTGTAGSAETEYLNGAACSGATTSTARQIVSTIGTLTNLQVYSSAAVTGGTGKDVLTVYKNGSATAVTCTIAAAGTTCSDTTHSVNVVPGDVLTFQFVSASSDTAANVAASVGIY